jgi:hypothetical protein
MSRAFTALVLAAALGAGATVSNHASAGSGADLPTLYVNYNLNCTFQMLNDAGASVTQIPPGLYQVVVSTPVPFGLIDLSGITDHTACGGFVLFRLTGPGVDLNTDLEFGDNVVDGLQATFQPGSYTAQDDHQPAVTRKVFTVSASASSGGSPGSSLSGSSSGSKSSGTTSSGSKQSAIGTELESSHPFRGTLAATVTAAGKLTLTRNGKGVATLKAGRYSFLVHDSAAKAGFIVQEVRKPAVTLTGVSFVGKHTVTVDLKAGQWMFYSSAAHKSYFIVTT